MNSLRSNEKSICGLKGTYCIMEFKALIPVFDRDSGKLEPEKELRVHMYKEFPACI